MLAGWVALVAGKVVEEQLEVSIERQLPGAVRGDEAEDFHRAVWSRVQVPVVTGNVDCGDLVADWVDTSNAGEPGSCQLVSQMLCVNELTKP